jgi:hypothetical protein
VTLRIDHSWHVSYLIRIVSQVATPHLLHHSTAAIAAHLASYLNWGHEEYLARNWGQLRLLYLPKSTWSKRSPAAQSQ